VNPFLIAEDDALAARALARMARDFGPATTCASLEEAMNALDADRPWAGVMVDIKLPDGSGLDAVEHVRGRSPDLPVVVISGFVQGPEVNRAARIGATFVCKPCTRDDLLPFFRRASERARKGEREIDGIVSSAVRRWGLSPRESEILVHAIRGGDRDEFLRIVGISVNTYKTQVRSLLRKADYESLPQLAIDALRSLLSG